MLVLTFTLTASTLFAQPQPPVDGFVPAQSLPPTEQLPAAPLLIAAYSVFLVLMMGYLWTIWRRIGKVEQEMQELAKRQSGQPR
ncbi:MAG: hypothetical protein LBQ09_10030 [Acidobacteriaceae bacterium]|jgi:type VI protein secretion system component VasF|nr:hypothetical protein [Acidobacteriaceae bacterium]